jgi:hypothetical protein
MCLREIWRNCALPRRKALRYLVLLDPLELLPSVVLILHSAPEVGWTVGSNAGWTVESIASADRAVWFERPVLTLSPLMAHQVLRGILSLALESLKPDLL